MAEHATTRPTRPAHEAGRSEPVHEPGDALCMYRERTLAVRQSLTMMATIRSRQAGAGDDDLERWSQEVANRLESVYEEPLDLLINVAEELELAGDELGERIRAWEAEVRREAEERRNGGHHG